MQEVWIAANVVQSCLPPVVESALRASACVEGSRLMCHLRRVSLSPQASLQVTHCDLYWATV